MEEKIKLSSFSKGGGCGCKIAPSVLQEILKTSSVSNFPGLLVGNESGDDAAVYLLNEQTALISTTDFFVPIVDDPFQFGKIAAANAISDVYAMGGQPMMALAILGWPIDKLAASLASEVLEGARAICAEAGIPLAGGHTIDTSEPIFGLSVNGITSPNNIKKNTGAKEGDFIFLTKPLGSGVLSTALKRGVLNEEDYETLLKYGTMLNKVGEQLGKNPFVTAMTDVTGFGIIGHALEICEGSGVGASIYYDLLPQMPNLKNYLQQRTIPDATFRNWNSYSTKVEFAKGVNVMEAFQVLPDPQTNGGILFTVSQEGIEDVKTILRDAGLENHLEPIGLIQEKREKSLLVSNKD